MTDPAAIIAGLVILLPVFAAAVVTILEAGSARRARVDAKDAAAIATTKADAIQVTATEIHSTTNSGLSALKAELAAERALAKADRALAQKEIDGLKQQMSLMDQARTTALVTAPTAPVQPAAIVVAPVPSHAVVAVAPGLVVKTEVSEKVVEQLDSIEGTVEATHDIVQQLPTKKKTP